MTFKRFLRGLQRQQLVTTVPKFLYVICIAFVLLACDPVDPVGENTAFAGRSLCFENYQFCIDPIFHANLLGSAGSVNCSSSGCHDTNAGSGGGFKVFLSPALNSEEMLSNFYTAQAFANFSTPSDSKLLLEPLTGTFSVTGSHAGGDILFNRSDPCYLAIIDWINEQVNDENSSSCGLCTPPTLSACGY